MCTHVIMTPQPPVVFFAGTEPAPTGASPRGAQARSAPRPALPRGQAVVSRGGRGRCGPDGGAVP